MAQSEEFIPIEIMTQAGRLKLNPRKLLMSKWTAGEPRDREKHFLVARVINPEAPRHKISEVEMVAVLTGRKFVLRWEDLADSTNWHSGWQ